MLQVGNPARGLTRCGEAVGSERSGWAERGNGPQSRDWRNPLHGTCQPLAALRIQRERQKRHARRRIAQKERASMAWFCSIPERDGRVRSKASSCSTASPVRASRHRSRMHTPRGRLPVSPEKLAWPNASLTKVEVRDVRVKCAGGEANLHIAKPIREDFPAPHLSMNRDCAS